VTVVAEYVLSDVNKPMSVEEYQLSSAPSEDLHSSFPTIEQIEQELGEGGKG
jgi:hypothetical protein